MILLCDTNIFLQANISSHLTLMRFFRETRKFFVGLDESHTIEQEYLLHGKGSLYLQNIIQRLQSERVSRMALSGELDDEKKQKLTNFAKQHQGIPDVELTMLKIALANPGVVIVCVDSQCHTISVNRQFLIPSRISILQQEFPGIKIKRCNEVVNELRIAPEGVPRDITSLESFLDSKGRREHDYLEFKQPQNGLVERMCKDIAKAVCAMLNTTDGFVVIGVDEDDHARVKGFEKTFGGSPKRVDELEIRLANDYLRKIEPDPDCLIHLWTIDKNLSRIVMMVFVEKGASQITYRYRFDRRGLLVFRRVGTQSCSRV